MTDRAHVLGMLLAPLTLTPVPLQKPSLWSHERVFKFSTEHFCQNTGVLLSECQGDRAWLPASDAGRHMGVRTGTGPQALHTGARSDGSAETQETFTQPPFRR